MSWSRSPVDDPNKIVTDNTQTDVVEKMAIIFKENNYEEYVLVNNSVPDVESYYVKIISVDEEGHINLTYKRNKQPK